MHTANEIVSNIREASRLLVRELGFMSATLAGAELPASAVHAIIEIGHSTPTTASSLSKTLSLDRSNISRVLAKLVEAGAVIETPNASDGRQKILSITEHGKDILDRIDKFANEQVMKALKNLPAGSAPEQILGGIRAYAAALRAQRLGEEVKPVEGMAITSGYRPGLLGRCLEMHMQYYSRAVGFGGTFEAQLATGLGELLNRLDSPRSEVWVVTDGTKICGTVFIDGEGLGEGKAHLRAFIVDDTLRGRGWGRKLIGKAISFVDDHAFTETHLYTFRGLDGKSTSLSKTPHFTRPGSCPFPRRISGDCSQYSASLLYITFDTILMRALGVLAARRLYESCGFALAEEALGNKWGKEMMIQHFVRIPSR